MSMASGFGVSANPTKANHKIGEDKVVRIGNIVNMYGARKAEKPFLIGGDFL
ncbi:hypothetical protein [Bacillus altitudinis]|uniref:Uncharacterized protein n=1 Tax=Bacillus altitudinis TaxID=293387 RepID=A0ABV1S2L3_BACAB|nr:hypothetical protein [Bacillus altitudinis]MCY7579342.1 hypothetical protein [Bacillus altitudinis]MCY7594653.1 hypothetical protein [Bacillus altitudinis]WJE31528.1 hypothetical protein QRD87_06525 [Bacillus altitudinis]WQH40078.1 hypothetical protein U2873_06090 [Bacillus altitudinis]